MRKLIVFGLFSLCLCFGNRGYAQFVSVADGNWNIGATWGNPGNDIAGSGFPSTGQTADVSHNVTIPTGFSATITDITIQPAVSLTISSTGSLNLNGILTILDDGLGGGGFLDIFGVLIANQGSSFVGDATNTATVYSAGRYQHNYTTSAGNLLQATWSSGSICEVIGYTSNTSSPGFINQSFHHLTWNCPNGTGSPTSFISLGAQLTTINGNLTVSATGGSSRTLRIFDATSGGTLNVAGDIIVNNSGRLVFASTGNNNSVFIGGNFSISNGVAASTSTLTAGGTNNVVSVTGNFTMNPSSTATFNIASVSGGSGTLNVSGNFSTNSSSTIGAIVAATSNINFAGTSVQTYSNQSASANRINYTVNASSIVDMGTSAFLGTGTFTNNGTIRIGSTDALGAIQTSVTNGNIRVSGLRTFNSSGTIVYNGTSAQFIGLGHPATSNTTINNSNGVTLASDVTINGNLILTSGNVNVSSNTLTLGANFTPNSNFLAVNSSSSLSIGGSSSFGNLAISGGPTINNFTLNRGSSGSITLVSDLTVNGTFTQSNGDINLNGNTIRISGIYSRTSGNKVGSSTSSIIVDGSGSFTGILGITSPLNTLTINRTGVTINTGSAFTVTNLNLLNGTFNNGGTITMASGGAVLTRNAGSLLNPVVAATSFDVTYTNSSGSAVTTGSELPTNASDLRNLTINSTDPINLNAAVTVNGTLTFTSGVFNAGSNAIDLKGNLVSNNTSTLTSSAITFSGTTSVTGSTAPVFGDVTITGSGSLTPTSSLNINGNLTNNGTLNSGSATVTFGGTTVMSGSSVSSFNNLVISPASSLTAPSTTINVAGTWTNSGTFTNNGGTVVFNGTTSIAGSSATNFGGVTISGTLTSPASLNVARNFTNNGTFVSGSGTLVLNGSSIQSISGTTTTTFNNITVTNTAGPPAVQVQSNQNLQGVLTLSANSQFDADGSSNTSVFTLLSTNDNSTSDASIAALPSGASVTGNVTVQRFMAIEGGNNTRIYRFISSPVQSAPVSQIQTFIPVTGTFSGASSCSGCGTSQSMFAYDESVITGDQNAGYINFPAAGNSETFTSGRGYSIFVRGNTAPISTAGNARWSLTGPINSGSINFNPFTTFNSSGTLANDGWNLVGNPYPSTIDWDAAGWTRTNINNAIYMRDNGQSGVFATYISGASVNGGSRYIPTGQAFFVKSDGGTIDFRATESVKAAGTQTTFFRQETVNDFLRMTLSGNGVRDEAVIRFQKEASDVYDSKQDARKLRNGSDTSPIVSLSSISSDGVLLAINSANSLGCTNLFPSKKIALMIDGVRSGSHQLSFSQLDSFTEDVMIVLHDQFKKDSVVVNQSNFAYDFDVTSDAKSFGRDRFSISFTCKNLVTSIPDNKENSIHIFPNPASDKVQIEIPYNSNIVATMLNSVGVPIGKVALIKEGDFWKGEFDLGSHATGFYFVQVSEGTKVYAKKVIKR
jgi:hypothetical protein